MRRTIMLAVLLLAATYGSATPILGSLPFVFVDVTSNGADLSLATILMASDSLTEGPGTGDLVVIPVLTSFGGMTIQESSLATGGGFAVANPTWGSFTATSATIIAKTPHFLNIDMMGTFTPGSGLAGFTAAPADAHVTFNQTAGSLSGAFTLSTAVPEPQAMVLFGTGLLLCSFLVRKGRES